MGWVLKAVRDPSLDYLFCAVVIVVTQCTMTFQVNTSGEDSKSGAETAEEALELVRYIREDCPNLVFKGLYEFPAPFPLVPC